MKKEKLDMLTKGVLVCAIAVFAISQFNLNTSIKNEVYGEELNVNYLGLEEDINEIASEDIKVKVEEGIQVIEFELQNNSYPNIHVQANKPVKLIINTDENSLNSCNYVIVSLDLGIQYQLDVGKNVIEFTPTESGEYVYSCWMGMIGANINVVDGNIEPSAYYGQNISQGGCCSYQ